METSKHENYTWKVDSPLPPFSSYLLLNLYKKGSEAEKSSYCIGTFPMRLTEKGVWVVKVEGDLNGN